MEGFKKIVKSHIKSLKAAQASRYLVADAALYVKESIVHLITHVNSVLGRQNRYFYPRLKARLIIG